LCILSIYVVQAGRLPLHVAVECNANAGIVAALLQAFPGSASEKTKVM